MKLCSQDYPPTAQHSQQLPCMPSTGLYKPQVQLCLVRSIYTPKALLCHPEMDSLSRIDLAKLLKFVLLRLVQ